MLDYPAPKLSEDERARRRLAYRNERRLYRDKCDLTGRDIVSLYSPDKPFKVYSQEAWWSDKFDPKEYGRDFDFNRPFFEQFFELRAEVPRIALMNTRAFNSEYCNATTDNKNCYLVFGGDYNEDCMYSVFALSSKDCSDCYWAFKSELCYGCIDIDHCYGSKYLRDCQNCTDCILCFDCRGCVNCFGCVGLRNKEYYILNKQYTKEEYEAKIASFGLENYSSVQKLKAEFEKFKLQFPHRFANIVNCENSTGDNLVNAKNCENCFDVVGPAEDLKNCMLIADRVKDCESCSHAGYGAELLYETVSSFSGYNSAFSTFVWRSSNAFYCDFVAGGCNETFGCVSMKKSEYCILNKQYSKEDYHEMKARIIEHMKATGEWGEFFPIEGSPFAYNETVANDYFPLSREEVLERGLKWHDEEVQEIGSGAEVPDSISDVGEEILKQTLVCEKTGRPFKLIEAELRLLKRLGVPVPRLAPETRNEERFTVRNPRRVWTRNCDNCGKEVLTSYKEGRPEKIFCEECYLKDRG